MRFLFGVAAMAWAFAGTLALLLFETPRGRGLALCVLLGLGCALALFLRLPWARWIGLGLLVSSVALLFCAPRARTATRGIAGQNWPGWSPLNLVPEGDLVRSGIKVLFPAVKGQVILPLLDGLYSEMEAFPEYRSMPHVIHHTGTDLLGRGNAAGHYYSYVPKNVEKPPLLVFLHGAMGNYQCFLYFFQKWAEKRGWAVICPSFGYGNWYRPGGGEAAEQSLLHALETLPVDRERVLLAGLSNGATGAVRLIRRQPDKIQGLILFSPVIEPEQYGSAEFRDWAGRGHPRVVMQGDTDQVVHPRTVESRLTKLGVPFDYRLLPGHDHYMMFSASERVYETLDELASP
jgi:dienelactone hydrolase